MKFLLNLFWECLKKKICAQLRQQNSYFINQSSTEMWIKINESASFPLAVMQFQFVIRIDHKAITKINIKLRYESFGIPLGFSFYDMITWHSRDLPVRQAQAHGSYATTESSFEVIFSPNVIISRCERVEGIKKYLTRKSICKWRFAPIIFITTFTSIFITHITNWNLIW